MYWGIWDKIGLFTTHSESITYVFIGMRSASSAKKGV